MATESATAASSDTRATTVSLFRHAEVLGDPDPGVEPHRRGRHGGEVDGREPHETPGRGQRTDLPADGADDGGTDSVVLRALRHVDDAGLRRRDVDADQAPGRREQHPAGGVGDLQRLRVDRGLPTTTHRGVGLGQQRAAGRAELARPSRRARSRPGLGAGRPTPAVPRARRCRRAACRVRPRARCARTSSGGAAAVRGCTRPGSRTGRRPPCSRLRAASESSEVRMTWMTSSMSRIAMSSPSTRCRRSLASGEPVPGAPRDDRDAVVRRRPRAARAARGCAARRRPARRC